MEERKYITGTYYERGRMLLLPLVGFSVQELKLFEPQVYLWWSGEESVENYELICLYTSSEEVGFRKYERERLLKISSLKACYNTVAGMVYIFDLCDRAEDVIRVIHGEYSRISKETKEVIRKHYGYSFGDKPMTLIGPESSHVIHMTLYPEVYYEVVATEIGVDIEALKKGIELGSRIDKDKETLTTEILTECDCAENKTLYL